ncbi:ectonucleoside triphosphate diphosphohydrolase [Acrasis kona]|uniref:Ectonucleoside triphosphate diphosphohydrolase n=1 Tax=Acrasis kona TaxID=1008807 RepID=A0AAW2YNX3_9EUKA
MPTSTMILLWLAFVLVVANTQAPTKCYGIMFDAGSSGTRIYVYNWPCRTKTSTPKVYVADDAPNFQVRPGISSFASNTSGVGPSMDKLLEFASTIVPANQKSFTPIFLRATAGMRLLTIEQQTDILNAIRTYFRNSGYRFDSDSWARVITGDEEGAFGWVAVNYLYNNIDLKTPPSATNTVLDCGGASVQLTFSQPAKTDPNNFYDVAFQDIRSYTLYTHSYLGYGNDQARKGVAKLFDTSTGTIVSPCFNTGFNNTNVLPDELKGVRVVGSGNYTQCRQLIREYMRLNDSCTLCSIQGNYQPAIPSTSVINGLNAYVFLADTLKVGEYYTLDKLGAVSDHFCNLTWTDAQASFKSDFLSTTCFQASLLVEMTMNGFKVAPSSVITARRFIGNSSVAWTLGAILYDISTSNCKEGTELCFGSNIDNWYPVVYVVPIVVVVFIVVSLVVIISIVLYVRRKKRLQAASYTEQVDMNYHVMK